MPRNPHWLLLQETQSMLARLEQVQPFSVHEVMVPAALPVQEAFKAIESHVEKTKRSLRFSVNSFLRFLQSSAGLTMSHNKIQKKYVWLRLQFNNMLSMYDIFSDVLTQRSEASTGVWLAGLDRLAASALHLDGQYFEPPPVVCYLDRGIGAAIRRARTRLPGGKQNPVAIIRVPRERMIGSGILSSLFHEVGHQAAALLNLVPSISPVLKAMQSKGGPEAPAWQLWDRWLSEIVSDLWSVAKGGLVSTAGLMNVVSLPRVFVFRITPDDPHPMPWLRVILSARMGNSLYPHHGWRQLEQLWIQSYPLDGFGSPLLSLLLQTMPAFVSIILQHRPYSLRGRSLGNVLSATEHDPGRLTEIFHKCMDHFATCTLQPATAFAAIGQARLYNQIMASHESAVLALMLKKWAIG